MKTTHYKITIFFLLLLTVSCFDKFNDRQELPIEKEISKTEIKTPIQKLSKTEEIPTHEIKPLNHINDIFNDLEKPTLLVFDVDATMIWVPGHTWPFKNVSAISLAEGNNTLLMFNKLKTLTSNQTKAQGSKIVFLTARPPTEAAHSELSQAGITFSTDWLSGIPLTGYEKGVLYANHANKGMILMQFLKEIASHYQFKKVIFVDDQKNNIDNVSNTFKNNDLIKKSISFHYTGAIHPHDDIIHTKSLGLYSYDYAEKNHLIRFKKNSSVLSREQFLQEIAQKDARSSSLRQLINKAVSTFYKDYPKGIKLKSPPISATSKDLPFFFLLQEQIFTNNTLADTFKNYFIHCKSPLRNSNKTDTDYTTRFLGIVDQGGLHPKASLTNERFSNATVFFTNKASPPDVLVAPCPFAEDITSAANKNLLHVGAYAQFLQDNIQKPDMMERLNTFWRAVGITSIDFLATYKSSTIYLHTHGTGVNYLHFRIDLPNYDYGDGEAPKLSAEPQAHGFYTEVFKN